MIDSYIKQVSKDVLEFVGGEYPNPHEVALRKLIIAQITTLVNSKDENATVNVFGSYATGLYLADGDIDIAIVHPIDSILNQLHPKLKTLEWIDCSSVEYIRNASVPIIKFKTARYHYQLTKV